MEACSRERADLAQEYRTDMVGLLEEMPDILNAKLWKHSEDYDESYNQLEKLLRDRKMTFEELDPILCRSNEFADAAEREGFRRGFHVAMQLCMEGMRGGAAI
ncbi:MAG: hypothetical protein LIO81_02330 [Clostridiales bacterium]|nr:hypothetical protein [Clostridiales bacterium]